MIKESMARDTVGEAHEVAVVEEQNEEPFDLQRMIPLVEVSEDEYIAFVKSYPRELEGNFFMDWYDLYDFSLDKYPYCCVARKYFGYGEFKYYIPRDVERMKK